MEARCRCKTSPSLRPRFFVLHGPSPGRTARPGKKRVRMVVHRLCRSDYWADTGSEAGGTTQEHRRGIATPLASLL